MQIWQKAFPVDASIGPDCGQLRLVTEAVTGMWNEREHGTVVTYGSLFEKALSGVPPEGIVESAAQLLQVRGAHLDDRPTTCVWSYWS